MFLIIRKSIGGQRHTFTYVWRAQRSDTIGSVCSVVNVQKYTFDYNATDMYLGLFSQKLWFTEIKQLPILL